MNDLAGRDLRRRRSRTQKKASLPDCISPCNWIRAEFTGEGVNVHVTAPQDATGDQLQELCRVGVRVTF